MAVTRYETVNNIVNRAAAEMGLTPVSNVFTDADPNFRQLRYQLENLGQDLIYDAIFQRLVKDWAITTDNTVSDPPQDEGKYALPDDYAYLINQTGWDTTNNLPIYGPLSDQNITRLEGRNLAGSTVYVGFKIENNYIEFFPGPPANDLAIAFKYVTRNWVDISGGGTFADVIANTDDVVLYDQMLAIHGLKFKFLDAKGFPSATAQKRYDKTFNQVTGKDTGAKVINLARRGRYPYLGTRNVPDTGYGT